MRSKKIKLMVIILGDFTRGFNTLAKLSLMLSLGVALDLIRLAPEVSATWQELLYLGLSAYLLSDALSFLKRKILKRAQNQV